MMIEQPKKEEVAVNGEADPAVVLTPATAAQVQSALKDYPLLRDGELMAYLNRYGLSTSARQIGQNRRKLAEETEEDTTDESPAFTVSEIRQAGEFLRRMGSVYRAVALLEGLAPPEG